MNRIFLLFTTERLLSVRRETTVTIELSIGAIDADVVLTPANASEIRKL